jgi:two-component system nitrate/nitrite response regulator NarL
VGGLAVYCHRAALCADPVGRTCSRAREEVSWDGFRRNHFLLSRSHFGGLRRRPETNTGQDRADEQQGRNLALYRSWGPLMRCINVLIADRFPVVVQGLRKVLGAQHNFKIVACCSDGRSCVEAIRSLRPDIAILDISMPGLTGLEILSIVNSEGFSTRVVFFTASVEDRELVMSAAAYGIILKDATPEFLVKCLQQVADGQRLLPRPSSDQLSPEQIAVTENALTVLTDREHEIMCLVSGGLSNKEIGRRLNISDGTIKVHLHHIYQKLEISNRTELAALAMSQTEISSPPRKIKFPDNKADISDIPTQRRGKGEGLHRP